MARSGRLVLLGWELGANQGHIVRLTAIAEALRRRGVVPVLVAQRLDIVAPGPWESVWQAPVWPGLLRTAAGAKPGRSGTLGDILGELGLDRAETSRGIVTGWDALLAAVQPAAVVADFAPLLLTAARGRIPTLAVGTGFTLPPAELDRFPLLSPDSASAIEEGALLQACAEGLRAAGREAPPSLPGLFAADVARPGVFPAFDPYAGVRSGSLSPPFTGGDPPRSAGEGREVFVYMTEDAPGAARLREGLIRSGLPVRGHFAGLPRAEARTLSDAGVRVEPTPVPLAEIVRSARLVVSHGGLGLTSALLLAGVPQIIVHYDLEKHLNGGAVRKLGVGASIALGRLDPEAFAEDLRTAFASPSLAATAQAEAHRHWTLASEDPAEGAADAVEGLLA
jgi:rhamnosyltransferase subunit B